MSLDNDDTRRERIVMEPLFSEIEENEELQHDVIIELNIYFPNGVDAAREKLREMMLNLNPWREQHVREHWTASHPFVFATLTGFQIRKLIEIDSREVRHHRVINRVWEDTPVRPLNTLGARAVKAHAAQQSFGARGEGIVWAVVDSGIDGTNDHFRQHYNLEVPPPVEHVDFTNPTGGSQSALTDRFGHGTHIAGIIAGEMQRNTYPVSFGYVEGAPGHGPELQSLAVTRVLSIAPECKLASFKVLDDEGNGRISDVIKALEHIQKLNGYGSHRFIHGVNLSLGYPFNSDWYACGQNPICEQVNRLVKAGVVVVAAAGNTGFGSVNSTKGRWPAGLTVTINDPGNAELAITVGSTHPIQPRTNGISMFSAKGPTADGRRKPDLVAPGERILSCAAGKKLESIGSMLSQPPNGCVYLEDSGTSMAAAHVSGIVAGMLSVFPDLIGQPEKVKQILMSSATDLGREHTFQGAGLVDAMRACMSV